MSEWLARFFRWNNAKLITTNNLVVEKLRKVLLVLSLVAYRTSTPASGGNSCPVVIRNFDGNLKLHIDRCRAMGSALFWTGFHEFREFQFLHRYLKPEMVFVDVGANLGEYTLFAAKRLAAGKVLAFEPLSSMRSVLEENIRLNDFKNIRVFPFGLSSEEETLTIHEFEDVHEGLATFFPGSRKSKSSVAVPLRRLDDILLNENPGRVDVVKIDIEGGELKALQGCRSTIEVYGPAFMVEINEVTYKTAGYTPKEILDFFLNVNYQAWEIERRGSIRKCHALPAFGNIIFMPQ